MPLTMPLQEHISQQFELSKNTNMMVSTLGNNIRQRARNGLNSKRSRIQIKWTAITLAQTLLVSNAIEQADGADYINYQSIFDAAIKKWVLEDGSHVIKPVSGDRYDVMAIFEQDH